MANSLITSKRFLPYFCTQFLGAFNDNIYRYAFAILVTYFLAKESQGIIVNIALGAFILPYFLLGAIAGQLADKYEKAWLIRRIKVAEIVIMILGSLAIYFQDVIAMLCILFCLGAQSAFFGPIKYSILPQHLAPEEILHANAYVEFGTFSAIVLGTILGGALAKNLDYHAVLMMTIIGLAVVGWFTARAIPSAPAAAPNHKMSLNIVTSSLEIIRATRRNRPVFMSILANSWFWFFGSIMLTQFPVFAKDILGGDADVAILLLTTFSIGIGIGSFACSIFSRGKVEVGLVPFGALGISFFTWQLGTTAMAPTAELRTIAEVMAQPGAVWVVFNLTMIAFSAGLFIVPLYAFMQVRSEEEQRSRTIAVNNIFNSMFMVAAAGLAIALLAMGFGILDIFKITAVLNLVVTLYIVAQIPEYFLRLTMYLLMHTVYRVDKKELMNIPKQGAAIIVCNHVSFFDPAILFGLLPRPARFVMWYRFYEHPIFGHLFKWLNMIPIGKRSERPELVDKAFDEVSRVLDEGRLVVIFPEGGITRTGEINKFQPGVEEIIKRNPVPVIPMALSGLWGTWSSRKRGRALSGFPNAFMKKLTVVAGEPVPPEKATRITLYEKVRELRGTEK